MPDNPATSGQTGHSAHTARPLCRILRSAHPAPHRCSRRWRRWTGGVQSSAPFCPWQAGQKPPVLLLHCPGRQRRWPRPGSGWALFQHGTGNGNALLLAAGKIHALGADDRMDALRELLHDIHALCSFQCCQHLGFGGLRPTQTDVVQNAALEQAAVLEHKGNGVHQLFLGDVPHIRSAHPDAAALHIKEPADKVCQRGFSAAGGAYKATVCPG